MGFVLAIVGALVVGGLLYGFLRGGASGTRTRLGPDGFFLSGYDSGTRVRYRVRVNGTWRDGEAEVTSGETFVYTGATPSEVEILDVEGGMAPSSSAPSIPPPPSSGGSDDSFTGFPSAY